MKNLLLALAVATAAIAGEPAAPNTNVSGVPPRRPPVTGAKEHSRRGSPLRVIRRLAQGEVNLAMRFSSWGIHDSAGAREQAGQNPLAASCVPADVSTNACPAQPER